MVFPGSESTPASQRFQENVSNEDEDDFQDEENIEPVRTYAPPPRRKAQTP